MLSEYGKVSNSNAVDCVGHAILLSKPKYHGLNDNSITLIEALTSKIYHLK